MRLSGQLLILLTMLSLFRVRGFVFPTVAPALLAQRASTVGLQRESLHFGRASSVSLLLAARAKSTKATPIPPAVLAAPKAGSSRS